jgi:hypothetical protein
MERSPSQELRDIREYTNDPDAYAAELERRWTGLLSYRYIGVSIPSMNTGPADPTVKVRHDMRNATGGLLVAPLSITAPQGSVDADLVAVPNPVIHSCMILDPARDVTRLAIAGGQILHRGSRMGYTSTKIVDADDPSRTIAILEGQGVKIGTPPEGLERMPENKLEVVDSPDLPPLWQVFGAWRRDDGHWMLPELGVEFASPDAALHLGPQHVALEAAAVDAAAELVGTDLLQMRAWHVMFLARGKIGPFRIEAEAMRGAADQVGVVLAMYDEGNGNRRVTSANAAFVVGR